MHHYKIVEQGRTIDKASKALIMLHGRGGKAVDMFNLARQLCDDTFYIAAPQATNDSWYPYSFMAEEKINEPWLSAAVDIVKRLIDEISRYLLKSQIYIIGFSQGACLALEASARYAAKYGGIVAFSGGLIGQTLDKNKYHGNFEGTTVFIGNSDIDPYIPLLRCEQSKELMENLGANVTLKVYEGMGHIINDDEINWVKKNMTFITSD